MEIGEDSQADVYYECYYFFRHFVDWYAYQWLGEWGQDLLLDDTLGLSIIPLLSELWKGADEEWLEPLISRLLSGMNEAISDYHQGVETQAPFSDQLEAKTSLLFDKISDVLSGDVPGFGGLNQVALEFPEFEGVHTSDQIELSLFVHAAVIDALEGWKLPKIIQDIRPLMN